MYDKHVRRRRAVLIGFVVASLVLLTASFGASPDGSGPLGAVQRGAMDVLNPVQEGASRALKPVRDGFGWVGDTWEARDERDALAKERNRLRKELDAAVQRELAYKRLRGRIAADAAYDLEDYDPVEARVNLRSNSVAVSTLGIDKGSSAGVQRDQPVVDDQGNLVGKVAVAARGSAKVQLLTDPDFGVQARTARTREPGTIRSEAGTLQLALAPRDADLAEGQRIVTAGTASTETDLRSLFPPDIPIGSISRIDGAENSLTRQVRVRPAAELRKLEFVRVLTKPMDAGAVLAANGP